MAYVNVAEWNPEHVVDWLRGLDDEIQPYTQFFFNNKVNGCQLLTLARDDLTNLNMTKIGHQELVLEAVEQLRQLHYNLTSETLQSLALKLGCKAQSLFNDLKRVCQDFVTTGKKERVSVETLSAVSDIINLVKSLISWLDRYPFVGQEIYLDVRKTILKLSIELASTAQRDQFAENPHGTIKDTCSKLTAQSDKIVQDFNDSLIIQPASLEVAKVKRKTEDDVGVQINSLYSGIHIIEGIKFQSPAYRSGKVEEGDEIVQVNYQTVVGWQVKNIICAMKEHPSEVHLTLKKRPRHPNVLGQVITLWPYRIPSKKTAFRKMYKWSKAKDIHDLCPKSPDNRGDSNSVSEMNGNLSEKEKLFAVNKPRNRLRRRATVTGVSPTSLRAPISLEDLIGNKRKDTVLRTISYDPNKTIDLEDNVFKRETQSCGQEEDVEVKGKEENETEKSTFLRPPTEKFMTSHLRRQEALKNSETVARAAVAVPQMQNDKQEKQPYPQANETCRKPPPISTQPSGSTFDSIPYEPPPSGSQSPRQKFADWVNRQKKKPEGLLQHALTLFSPDEPSSPKGSPKSPKCNGFSPKGKKTSSNIFQFPFREGRPSLSELRNLKKTANSKAFSERVSSQGEKSITSPKQNPTQKRNPMQLKKSAISAPHLPKHIKPLPEPNATSRSTSKLPDAYIHPRNINYSRIPQFPCEMHESKIVSLKSRSGNSNILPSRLPPPQPSRNNLHYQRLRQMAKMSAQNGNQKISGHQSYSTPSGRSLSFNNIADSSEDDSSSEEYDPYEEVPTESTPRIPSMDPSLTRQLSEMYNMISQRQQFLQSQGQKGHMSATDSAVIDELALRMYHALQMTHMQNQKVPSNGNHLQVPPRGISPPQQHLKGYTSKPSKPCHQTHEIPEYADPYAQGKCVATSIREHPVDLPPSGYHPARNGFKSATSQQIHTLYTSQLSGKSISPDSDRALPSLPECEKEHMYETIPYQKKSKKVADVTPPIKPERSHVYPAEKEFEPCKEGSRLSSNKPLSASSQFIQDNMFCPIKESNAFQQPEVKRGEISTSNRYNDSQVQPALSTLMMNLPRPPIESYSTSTKSSSCQTESEISDSMFEESDGKSTIVPTEMCLTDESFTTALNYFNGSISDSLGYCSSSSLNSSSSGSTISSSGSCYYYVETQVKPQFSIKFPPTNDDEEAPLIDLRSPTLQTQKSECNSDSDHEAPRSSPKPLKTVVLKPHSIVTDVEHTF